MNKLDQEKTKNLAAGDGFRLHEVPAGKFINHAQYIENQIMPAIAARSGSESAEYNRFREIFQALLYAVMVRDRENNLLNKLQQLQQMNLILSNRLAFAEKELLKYATMEDLYLTEAYAHIENGVRQRAQDLLFSKQKTTI